MTPLTSLNAPQTVFCVFFAIFWGLVANAQVRWKAFDWPLALAGRKDPTYKPSWKRLKRSIVYLTLFPIVIFLLLIALLTLATPRPLGPRLIIQFAAAIFAALAAFAPYRLWLSGVERRPADYYYRQATPPTEPQPAALAGHYAAQPDQTAELHLDPKWSHGNCRVAWGYVAMSVLVALAAILLG